MMEHIVLERGCVEQLPMVTHSKPSEVKQVQAPNRDCHTFDPYSHFETYCFCNLLRCSKSSCQAQSETGDPCPHDIMPLTNKNKTLSCYVCSGEEDCKKDITDSSKEDNSCSQNCYIKEGKN